MRHKDLTGEKFGRLTVLTRYEENTKHGSRQWVCKCSCGKTTIVTTSKLNKGHTKSCGCLIGEKTWERNRKKQEDLLGKTFGQLTVIAVLNELSVSKTALVTCKCSCGKTINIRSASLMSGHTRSCGCRKQDKKTREAQAISRSATMRKKYPKGYAGKNKLYAAYKKGAKDRNLCFCLSKSEFFKLTKENCYYCGIAPKQIHKGTTGKKGKFVKIDHGDYTYNGIDRVDNTIGYTLDNCVPCCKVCNMAKMKHNKKDFINWISKAYQHLCAIGEINNGEKNA